MPFYQFTIPAGSLSAARKAEIARAVTAVHSKVTGAPERYVNVFFVEVPADGLYAGGEPVGHGRLVGIIRSGRTIETKRELLHALANAWSEVTGEPVEGFAIFLVETPGNSMMEYGEILPEASEDRWSDS